MHRLCAPDDLREGELAEFILEDVPLAVARIDGEYHAIANTCPHAGGPLGDGTLEGTQVRCPWHGWGFDMTTGRCALDPSLQVPVYAIERDEHGVWVRLRET
ncbi:MAG: Rieske 2Fe-2S domain-containing protein [Alphaproteobacteria bacterium]|nr:Rieske 2Fe-2S domain-containing protein [Alphaproteobacteria bacterium]